MAPPNKRRASPTEKVSEDAAEAHVLKRIKDDPIKPTNDTSTKDITTEGGEKHNNNYGSVASESNGSLSKKVVDGDVKTAGAKHDDKVKADDQAGNSRTTDTAVNGAKKEEDSKQTSSLEVAKVTSSNKKQSETNGNKKETATKTESAVKTEQSATFKVSEANKTPEPEDEPSGTLLISGGANWDMTGRKELPKTAKKPVEVNPAAKNLWGPHKVCLNDKALRVKGVFSGCNACHSVIVTDDGRAMTFGRNDKGQLGLGDTETRTIPVVVEAFKGINIVAAACGRSHTLFLDSNGIVYSCGDNKMGQCGTNQQAVQQILSPNRIAFKENKPVVKLACGAEFSMIVDIDGKLYSFGHPEHGQLGHNSEGKYFTTGNKYAFHCEHAPRRVVTFIEKSREGHVSPVDDVSIIDIACGTNHTLAVDKKNRCFSWGFAGYHRLGHSETKNELVPRSIKVFDAPNNSGRGAARVFAGAQHSMALDVNGLLYFWGQNKSSGEATMYPKNVQDLCGWRISAVACANRSIFVVADETCISWGASPTYGELGYGEGKSKSSTTPQEVKPLEGVHVINVACGFGHTLLMARDKSSEDQAALKKLSSWP